MRVRVKCRAEQEAFAKRLIEAMGKNELTASPATLAKMFNAVYQGEPISNHACRRWLQGTALPNTDKFAPLAACLNVNETWLLFGDAAGSTPHTDLPYPISAIVALCKRLTPPDLALVLELSERLAKQRSSASPGAAPSAASPLHPRAAESA